MCYYVIGKINIATCLEVIDMPRKVIIPNLDDFLKRYQSGESENKLAHEIGINRMTFRKRLLKAGIKPRGGREAELIKWSNMSIDKRKAQVVAAHNACRGRIVTFDESCRRAKSREGTINYNVSRNEVILGESLKELGLEVIHNLAVGPYSCDIGTGSVAVEVWGGGWHPKIGEVERIKYILDSGLGFDHCDRTEALPAHRRSTRIYSLPVGYFPQKPNHSASILDD